MQFPHLARAWNEAIENRRRAKAFANLVASDVKELRSMGCYNISVKRHVDSLAALVTYTDNRGKERVYVMDEKGRKELTYGSEIPTPMTQDEIRAN